VLEPASSGRRTSTFSHSASRTALISSILLVSEASLYSRASSSLVEPPTRSSLEVGAGPNWQRDAPPSCARLAACRAPCPAGKAPPTARPLRKAAARRTSGTGSPASPPPSQQQGRIRLNGPRCPISPRQPTMGSGPVFGPCARPNPEAEVEAAAESREPTWPGAVTARSQTQQPAHQPSLHCKWHVLPVWMEYSGQSMARPRLRRGPCSVMH
jgi:hypothetical protein